MDNSHQGEGYSAKIARDQAELRRKETFTDQKTLSITSLKADYLKFGSSSSSGKNNEIANLVQTKCTFCGGANHSAENFFKG